MPVRVFRLAWYSLWIGGLTSAVHADVVTIRFNELEHYASSLSVRSQLIEQEYELVVADRDLDLSWSNPEISYDREVVDRLVENQVTIAKQFEVPWAYIKKRSAWSKRMRAADFSKTQSTIDHLSELKSGYVSLKLQDEYLQRLGQLRSILTDASQITTSRHTEGHLSGVEAHLVQMSVISLHANFQAALQERRETDAVWSALLGLAPGDSLSLGTPIGFLPVLLEPADHYVARIDSQPGAQARVMREQYLMQYAAAERGRIVPSISVYGGYKMIEPDFDGYVAGFALSLPLFNLNRTAARRFELEGHQLAAEHRSLRREQSARVASLVQSISDANLPLAGVVNHFAEDLEALSGLLYAYDEGILSLNELLSGLQIELTGLRDYFEQLSRYYHNIFALEAITGMKLVDFP